MHCTIMNEFTTNENKLSTHFPEHHKRMILSFQKSVDRCFEQVQSPGTCMVLIVESSLIFFKASVAFRIVR